MTTPNGRSAPEREQSVSSTGTAGAARGFDTGRRVRLRAGEAEPRGNERGNDGVNGAGAGAGAGVGASAANGGAAFVSYADYAATSGAETRGASRRHASAFTAYPTERPSAAPQAEYDPYAGENGGADGMGYGASDTPVPYDPRYAGYGGGAGYADDGVPYDGADYCAGYVPPRRRGQTAAVSESGRAGRRSGRPNAARRTNGFQPPAPQVRSYDDREDDFGPKGHPAVSVTVIVLCLLCVAALAVLIAPQWTGRMWKNLPNLAFINGQVVSYDITRMNNYKLYREYMQTDTIFPGVYVDGVHVGGLPISDADLLLSQNEETNIRPILVTVQIGNRTWTIDNSNVRVYRNQGNVLSQAYAAGRQNTTAINGTGVTPYKQRLDSAMALRETPRLFTTDTTYERGDARAVVDQIAAYVNRAPIDAQVKSFDFSTRRFTFTDEASGVGIDADDLYQQVIAKLDAWEYGATITVEPEILPPKATKVQLMNSYKLIGAYNTATTSNSNRNNNIDLACRAINGGVLQPGEQFSFNQATGQRTTSKGYREAGAISSGQTIDEVGGGVCQVSSTLFNAVARADLEIVYRSPHAWPSSYVNKGEDATVNWPDLDFKFRNNRDTPVFIVMYYYNRKCYAEIYGMTLGEGVSIELESLVKRTLTPPSQAKYVQNTSLPAGTSKETVKQRTGYVVETFKVWYRNGTVFKRELMHTSTYKAYQQTFEYN